MMKVLTLTELIVVNQLQVCFAGRPGQVLPDGKVMYGARKAGHCVAEAIGNPVDEVKFLSDEPGLCPMSHSNLPIPRRSLL